MSYFCIIFFSSFAIISAHPRHHVSRDANADREVNKHTSSYQSYVTVRRQRHDGEKRSFFILEQPDQRVLMNPALSSLISLNPLSLKIRSDSLKKNRKHALNNRHKKHHSKGATQSRNHTSKHRHRHDVQATRRSVQRNTPKARSLKNIYGYLYGFHKARRPLDSLASGIIG